MKLIKSIFLFIFIIHISFGQSEKPHAGNEIELTKDRGSLDIDFLSVEFASTFITGSRSKFGYAVQLGPGFRFILNNPTYLYCGGGCDSGDCCGIQKLKAAYFGHTEFTKIKFFWRFYLRQNTYINTGVFGSLGRLTGGDISNHNYFTGIHFDFYTGWNRIKFGLKTQSGFSFMIYTSDKKTDFFMMTIAPAIQYQFK